MRQSRTVRLAAGGTAALLAAGGFLLVQATSASAEPVNRYVATTGDDVLGESPNPCTVLATPCQTIAHAVDEANANDTVSIAAGTYDESVHIRISLTLVGAGTSGANRTRIDGFDGDASVFVDGTDTDSTPTVTISNLDVSGNTDADGIDIMDANVLVKDSAVNDNDSNGVGVQGTSQLTFTDSSADGNRDDGIFLGTVTTDSNVKPAAAEGSPTAAITNADLSHNGEGGLASAGDDATITGSSVDSNGAGGAEVEGPGTLSIESSTIDSNNNFGVVAVDGATLHLDNSTVSNTNSTGGEGPDFGIGVAGIFGGTVTVTESTVYRSTGTAVLSALADVEVRNSTIAGTRAGGAGGELGIPDGALSVDGNAPEARVVLRTAALSAAGVTPQDSVSTATLTVRATIVADNTPVNCSDNVADHTYNLSDDASCAFSATGSKNKGDAKLGSFGTHGGPTKTLVPVKGSDAIDQIPTGKASCSASSVDQRMEPRLEGPKCDIGAVEVHQTPLVITPASLANGTVGVAYSATFTATGGLGAPYEFSLAPGSHLPDGLSLSSAGVLSGTPAAAGTYTFTISVDDPTLKSYTLVIGGGTPPLADTGAKVSSLLVWGGSALVLGIALLLTTGYAGRRQRQ